MTPSSSAPHMATCPVHPFASASTASAPEKAEQPTDAEPLSCPVASDTGGEAEITGGKSARKRATKHLPAQSWPPSETIRGPFREDADPAQGLSTVVVASNIPKADGGVWEFPSPQRFYNAMKKKGYKPEEEDMPIVVSIHNTMNERVWQKVLAYERLHSTDCTDPRLRRFYRVYGKPEEKSPKSRFLELLGYKGLFDRHDWFVDRCGKEVRYVIDFYQGRNLQSDIPAVVDAAWDRVRVGWSEWWKGSSDRPFS